MVSRTFLVAALGASFTFASPNPFDAPELLARTQRSTETPTGCYNSIISFEFAMANGWQTSGLCADACAAKNKPVIAVNGTDCWCSDTLPPKANLVDSSKCNEPCLAWPTVMCGSGANYVSTWNAGLKGTVQNVDTAATESAAASSSAAAASSKSAAAASSSSSATKPAVVTVGAPGQTVVVTQSSTPVPVESSGPNKAGIAAGVVVGVVVIAAAAGGLWFFLRAKKRREVEEEYKRQAAINAFVKPGSTEVTSFDTRLEPAIMRRMSDGSIADNQDYSRRILKVTNA